MNYVYLSSMGTLELKNKVINLLSHIDDNDLLEQIIQLINSKNDFYFDLSEEEKNIINAGIKDVEEGKIYPYEKLLKKYK